MLTNRRMFLSGLGAALAWRPELKAAASPLAGIAAVTAPMAKPTSGFPLKDPTVAEAILAYVAQTLHQQMVSGLNLARHAQRDFAPLVSWRGDIVNFPRIWSGGRYTNTMVVLDKHWEANFSMPDTVKAMERPELLRLYTQPAATAIAERIDRDLLNVRDHRQREVNPADRLFVTRRLPMIIPGTGALSRYEETHGIGTRTVLSYDATALRQVFTFDILAGFGVLA